MRVQLNGYHDGTSMGAAQRRRDRRLQLTISMDNRRRLAAASNNLTYFPPAAATAGYQAHAGTGLPPGARTQTAENPC